MKKYVCDVCGYVYDPEENGGVAFEDLPDDYVWRSRIFPTIMSALCAA